MSVLLRTAGFEPAISALEGQRLSAGLRAARFRKMPGKTITLHTIKKKERGVNGVCAEFISTFWPTILSMDRCFSHTIGSTGPPVLAETTGRTSLQPTRFLHSIPDHHQ